MPAGTEEFCAARLGSSGAPAAHVPPRESCEDDRLPDGDPGAELRHARLAVALSLDELTQRTKVPQSMLRAIEALDVARLPARVYIRGFVQAYAREVGLDPEVMARRYLSALDALTRSEARQDSDAVAVPSAPAPSRPRATSRQVMIDELRQQNRWVFVAAAAFLVYLAIVSREDRLAQREVVSREPASTASAPAQLMAAAPETGATATPSPAPASAGRSDLPLRIELAADGPCWLQATVDGERVVYRLLAPGERHMLTVQREAVLRVGDPGALRLSINGEPAAALGSPGQPVTVRITPDSYQALLDS